MVLVNKTQARNVFWQVGTSADLATDSFFNGTILASSSITLVGAPNVKGRLLALNGAVSLSDGSVVTNPSAAAATYMPPSPVSLASSQGNFWINYTWNNGSGNVTDSYNVSLINNSIQYWINGSLQKWTNSTIGAHNWSNISVYAFNSSGTGTLNATPATNNTQVTNNVPVQTSIGDKTVTAGNWLNFTVVAADADGDTITYGTNATNGSTLNTSTGNFNWSTTSGDVGTHVWYFNSSDAYGGVANETITVTVNVAPTYGVNLTSISGLTQSVPVSTNATYTFSIRNNGSLTDNYTINVSNPNNASYGLNITSPVMITSGETQIFTLNVSNASSGTFRVNITANSTNDPTKLGYVNTTTIVTPAGSVRTPVDLGTAGNFVILSKSGISTTGTTSIVGDIGVSPIAATAITGFGLTMDSSNTFSTSSLVTGNVYAADYTPPTPAKMTTAVSDMETAYTAAAGRTLPDATELGAGEIGGLTLAPGLYKWSSGVLISTDVTLSGNSTDVWIFQIAQTLDISNGKQVILSGGAQAKNIFWQVAGQTTLGTTSVFNGNILDQTAIVLNNGATLNGRALAQTAVTLDANAVTAPVTGTLSGSYIKSGTLTGVSGARVNITNSTFGSVIATTDASGAYSVSLKPGIYTINVSKTGYLNNSTTKTVASNIPTTVPTISLSPNTVTVTANRTVGSADAGQNVNFNLTVVNTGDDATFNVTTEPLTNASTNVTTTPSSLLLTTGTSTGVVVTVNNGYFGGWPVTITISNSSQSKTASVTLTAIMRNSSDIYTNISGNNVDANSTVTDATLENTTIGANVTVSGNSTFISDANVTGAGTRITDGAVIKGTYADSNVDNSIIGNATVDSSNLTRSTLSDNASVTNSTLTDATVANSTLDNVTVTSTSIITDVANLANIIIRGVDVTGVAAYDYEGELKGSSSAGSVEYQGINFTRVYTDVRISQLVIEQSSDQTITSNTNTSINDTSLGTSMNFSMTVNLTRGMVINISETGISPDGAGFSSGTQLGNFLVIRSNDTNASNVTSHTLRLYFDTDPSTYSGGVAIYYYNTSTSAWEKLTTTASGTEGGRYYREAAPNHFSTFALLGTTTTTTTTTTSGGGTSTGSGGVTTSEPYTNIEKSERYDKSLIANTPVTYTFKVPELGIYEIAVTGKESENDIALRVEVLKGTSKLVTVQAPGTVYKNVNVWAGTKRMKEALIRFRVENSWLVSNSLAASDIKMVRWDGSKWDQLETTVLRSDSTYTYFEAKTLAFSSFAITGIKAGSAASLTPVGTPAGTPGTTGATPRPVATPGTEAPPTTLYIIGALILIGIIAVVVIKRKEIFK